MGRVGDLPHDRALVARQYVDQEMIGRARTPLPVYLQTMGEPQSTKTTLLQVRMTPELKAKLERYVERLNDAAFDAGQAPSATISDLVRTWIEEKIEAPAQKSLAKGVDQEQKPASNVLLALEKLRGV